MILAASERVRRRLQEVGLSVGSAWLGRWDKNGRYGIEDHTDIAVAELLAPVVILEHLGAVCDGLRISLVLDNEGDVAILNRRRARSKDRRLQDALRRVFRFATEHECAVVATHLAGEYNTIADVLSRPEYSDGLRDDQIRDLFPGLTITDIVRCRSG
jgi:hypothetical protein